MFDCNRAYHKKVQNYIVAAVFIALGLVAFATFFFNAPSDTSKKTSAFTLHPDTRNRIKCDDLEGPAFLLAEHLTLDMYQLHQIILECGEQEKSFNRVKDLNGHLKMIATEFSGRPLVEYYVIGLTVLMRRGIEVEASLKQFEMAWEIHQAALLQGLSSRWLISTCDTILDFFTDATELAAAARCVLFGNTVKLYETERFALSCNSTQYMRMEFKNYPLYDGVVAFLIGRGDDAIRNLKRRLDNFKTGQRSLCLASKIMLELLSRAEDHDTVFRRLKG
jgi:hypothetical protein